ncbi:MAG TPA: AcvB/VirJ family lysyl-phosphatidylglycerol hydrolase [bacterium]|nr:AcvB/VirJ family lysyl-phosphatidylglycerol hydrolase [bacterium]HPR87735.1 AcvB/VirJ family lysyl-phosphatidylglycerol hydrolase [bacterium]
MKKRMLGLGLALCIALPAAAVPPETLNYGRFGKIWLYQLSPRPPQVVLFISGDGGWNLGVVDMARALAGRNALVVGIDITHYLRELNASREGCVYPAADFEMLSKYVQQTLGYTSYVTPILAGYSSGATLVYATLVQAPFNTFAGGISLGFCPDLALHTPMCHGSGLRWSVLPRSQGVSFLPVDSLQVPWIVLQGLADQVCNGDSTAAFVRKVQQAEIVLLPGVGHGFAVTSRWQPAFLQAFARLAAPAATPAAVEISSLGDLPVVEAPASAPGGEVMALHITGDGGYGITDKGLSRCLAAEGVPVAVLNALKYFWTRRTPEETTRDVQRMLEYYTRHWHKEKIVLIGYSFGADVLPFVISRLPEAQRARIVLAVFLGLSPNAEFEFHLSTWMGGGAGRESYPVRPELDKLAGMKLLCFCGSGDTECLCRSLDPARIRMVELKGGHRIAGNFAVVARTILNEIK